MTGSPPADPPSLPPRAEPSARKTSAHYQALLRQRRKEKGWVKKDIYVPAGMVAILKEIETALQEGIIPLIPQQTTKGSIPMNSQSAWNTRTLGEALSMSEPAREGEVAFRLVEGIDPVIEAVVQDREEFPIYITVSGPEVLVVTYLFPVASVPPEQQAALNRAMLEANPVLPLSDFGIMAGNYVLFGSLSSGSSLTDVLTDILALSANTLEAIESFSQFSAAA